MNTQQSFKSRTLAPWLASFLVIPQVLAIFIDAKLASLRDWSRMDALAILNNSTAVLLVIAQFVILAFFILRSLKIERDLDSFLDKAPTLYRYSRVALYICAGSTIFWLNNA